MEKHLHIFETTPTLNDLYTLLKPWVGYNKETKEVIWSVTDNISWSPTSITGKMYINGKVIDSVDSPYYPTSAINLFAIKNSNIQTINFEDFDLSGITSTSEMFLNCIDLTIIKGFLRFKTNNVTDMSGMFEGTTSLQSFNISHFDTSNVTTMSKMFKNCKLPITFPVASFNTENVTDLSEMFYGCTNLKLLYLENWDTSNVTNFEGMFAKCSSLTDIDISTFDFTNTTSVKNLFLQCTNLTSVNIGDLSKGHITDFSHLFESDSNLTTLEGTFDLSYAENTGSMFAYCNKLDLSFVEDFDMTNVTNAGGMFVYCNIPQLDLSSWNVSNLVDASGLFSNCKLQRLDLTGWNTSSLENMDWMFQAFNYVSIPDTNIVSDIVGLSDLDTSKVTSMKGTFAGIKKDTVDISNWDLSSTLDRSYMFLNANLQTLDLSNWTFENTPKLFNLFNQITLPILTIDNWDFTPYFTLAETWSEAESSANYLQYLGNIFSSNQSPSIIYAVNCEERTLQLLLSLAPNSLWITKGANNTILYNISDNELITDEVENYFTINGAKINVNNSDTTINYNYEIKSIYAGPNTYNKYTTFSKLDFTNTDLSNVVSYNDAFSNLEYVEEIIFGDTAFDSATNLYEIFDSCYRLEKVTMPNVDWSKINNSLYMFYSCESVKELNLQGWKHIQMSQTIGNFSAIEALDKLDISNWSYDEFSGLTIQLDYMFGGKVHGSDNLEIIARNIDFGTNTTVFCSISGTASSIFTDAKIADITGWKLDNVSILPQIFYNCLKLTEIRGLDVIDYTKLSVIDGLFSNCKLLAIDFNIDASNLTSANNTFLGIEGFTSLTISNFDGTKCSASNSGFEAPNCTRLIVTDSTFTPSTVGLVRFSTAALTEKIAFTNCNINVSSSLTELTFAMMTGNVDLFDLTDSTISRSTVGLLSIQGSKTKVYNFTNTTFTNINSISFAGNSLLEQIIGLENLVTSNIVDCSNMFGGDSLLQITDLTNWDMLNVTNVASLFGGCGSVSNLNLSGWNLSNVTSSSSMFYTGDTIEVLNISNWTLPSSITNMFSLSNILTLNISNWNTENFGDGEELKGITGLHNVIMNNCSLLSISVICNLLPTYYAIPKYINIINSEDNVLEYDYVINVISNISDILVELIASNLPDIPTPEEYEELTNTTE